MCSMTVSSPWQKVFKTSLGLCTCGQCRVRHQMASFCITRDPNSTASSQVPSSGIQSFSDVIIQTWCIASTHFSAGCAAGVAAAVWTGGHAANARCHCPQASCCKAAISRTEMVTSTLCLSAVQIKRITCKFTGALSMLSLEMVSMNFDLRAELSPMVSTPCYQTGLRSRLRIRFSHSRIVSCAQPYEP